MLRGLLSDTLDGNIRSGVSDEVGFVGQQFVAVEPPESGVDFFPCQVAGGPKDNKNVCILLIPVEGRFDKIESHLLHAC